MRNVSFVLIMLLAGCAAGKSDKALSEADAISKWIGAYDSVSGRCGGLRVEESKITWGSCKEASAKLISVSTSEWVMAVDPSAVECGWAGAIVALGDYESGRPPKITISAYQTLEDYRAANRIVQCSYLKKNK
jgi:hypothetical protein